VLVLAVTFTTTAGAQTYSDLYNFGGITGDPTNPQSSGIIAQGRDGELYSIPQHLLAGVTAKGPPLRFPPQAL
jgi:hypothetical protein